MLRMSLIVPVLISSSFAAMAFSLTVHAATFPLTQTRPCSTPFASGETAVVGVILAPNGRVTIPELGLTVDIVNACFEFRHLTLPRSPMLLSFDISADDLQPAHWANELVLTTGNQAFFTPALHQSSAPERVDPCPTLLQTPQQQLSAAEQQQASLCPNAPPRTPALPSTGTGSGSSLATRKTLLLLGLGANALLVCVLAGLQWRRRARSASAARR